MDITRKDRFYDGHTAKPHAISVNLAPDILILSSAEDQRQLACWVIPEMITVDSNDLNGDMTFRQRTNPEARLILGRSEIRARLLEQAPHLKHWRRQQRLVVGRTIGLLTVAGLVLLLGCYFGLPRLAIALVDVLPLSVDQKLGDPVHDSIVNHAKLCSASAGQAALDDLGARLLPDGIAAIPLTLDVVDSKEVNAFALPGNHIVVYSGLIAKAETPEMLAGVLAHEMGHLEMRHPTRGLIEQVGLGAAINLLAGNNAISNAGQVMAGLSYSRDMERQADDRAIALLHRAAIRADGLAAFFAVLKKDEKLHLPAMLSDHPGLDERALATQQGTTGGPAMSAAAWKSLKAICQP